MQAILNPSLSERVRSLLRLLAMTTLFSGSGIVCISAWQAYGDAARRAIAEWVPQLAPIISPRQDQSGAMVAPSMPMTASAARADGAASTAIMPEDPAQLLQAMVRDVAAMGQDMAELKERLGRLAANRDVMARGLARKRQANARSDLRAAMAAAPPQSPAATPETRGPITLPAPSIPRPR